MATEPGQLDFQEPTFDNRNPAVSAESQVTQAMTDIKNILHSSDDRQKKDTSHMRSPT